MNIKSIKGFQLFINIGTQLLILLVLCVQVQAYNSTVSVSTEKTSSKVVQSNSEAMNLKFHFGDIQTLDVKTSQGIFTELRMDGAYSSNLIGEPKLPVQRKLIAIPFGAEINVQVNNFTVSTIDLNEEGVNYPLMPLQYDIPKNMDVTDVPFQYNEQAYASKSFNQSEIASIEILGVMRGVRLARVTVEPVRFNPSTNQLEVYNDIDITLSYNGANISKTQQTFKNTYSPFFDVVYKQLLNVDDVYDEHPDLLQFPVNMLIVADPMFTETLQPFLEWKTKMGYELTVAYTDEIGGSSSEVQTWVHDQYNAGVAAGNAPDFLVIVGDVQQVPASATGSSSGKKTDLYYGSVDGDYFPEMYYGRMSAQNTTQLENMLNKIIPYEKYEMADPTYLDNITLIAGADGTWNPRVGQATIEYGTENYFNTEHGYNDIGVFLNSYSGCYAPERIAVGFINYTAHCSETSWGDPNLTISAVNNFTNTGKYPLAIGNCCLAADFGTNECIGEAWIRAEGKGAVGYIGSSPSSYWFEDFYWSVGAFPVSGNNDGYVPSAEETTLGAYDGAWGESYFCQDALIFVGNLAVTEVDIQGYAQHSSPTYYWQAYNTFGDPSLMPYHTQGSVNPVTHMDIIPIGVSEYEVSAEPGSYVAISKDGEIYGTGHVGESGTVMVEMDPIHSGGDVDIVVTKSQYIPYMVVVPATSIDETNVFVNPNTQDVNTSEIFSTTIDINNISNLGSFELEVEFDSDLLQANLVTLGAFLGSTGRQIFPLTNSIDNNTGLIEFAATSLGNNLLGPDGNGVLLNIEWTATDILDGDVTTLLIVKNVQVTHPNGSGVDLMVESGTVNISACYAQDFDCDCDVDIVDVTMAAYCYGSLPSDDNYDPRYDLDSDGDIDIVDITMVAYTYGWSCDDDNKGLIDFVGDNDHVELSFHETEEINEEGIDELEIMVKNIDQLGGYELELAFAEQDIEIIEVQNCEFFEKTNRKKLEIINNTNDGRIKYAITSLGFEDPGLSGEACLLTIKYRNKGLEKAPFDLIKGQLVRIDGQIIPFSMNEDNNNVELHQTQILNTYPNPLKHQFNIDYQIKIGKDIDFILYNVFGESLAKWRRAHDKAGAYSFYIKDIQFPSGIYILSMEQEDEILDTQRIIIE